MANRTETTATTVHGTNPQFLIEKIVRNRIYEAIYWKEHCFALDAEGVTEKALQLTHFGGTYAGNVKPTDFLCLTLKMLQLQLDKDVIVEFIRNEDYRYLRALGAFYMRLTGDALDVYEYLEPLYNDGRRLRRKNVSGQYEWTHMDELVDELLREEYMCNIALPRLPKREIYEQSGQLPPRKSVLEDELSDSEPEAEPKSTEVQRMSTRSASGEDGRSSLRGGKRHRDEDDDIERDRRTRRRHSSDRPGDGVERFSRRDSQRARQFEYELTRDRRRRDNERDGDRYGGGDRESDLRAVRDYRDANRDRDRKSERRPVRGSRDADRDRDRESERRPVRGSRDADRDRDRESERRAVRGSRDADRDRDRESERRPVRGSRDADRDRVRDRDRPERRHSRLPDDGRYRDELTYKSHVSRRERDGRRQERDGRHDGRDAEGDGGRQHGRGYDGYKESFSGGKRR